jgi:heterokaryon incompatibility protein (HET)
MVLDNPASQFVSGRPVVTDIAGELALSAAKLWLLECFTKHKRCHYQSIPVLPIRVVDVGTDASTGLVKLHVRDRMKAIYGAYSALSYCWGGPQSVVNKIASLDDLKSGILISTLPQSIRDAIEVTRRLDIRYLWVNALCIVQDSMIDKQEEVNLMGSIYKNVTVTISVSVASSANDGFLRIPRKIPQVCNFELPISDGIVGNLSIIGTEPLKPKHPLDKRGWAFQEKLLSPRLLQFSELELIWTCQTEPIQTVTKGVVEYKKYNNDWIRLPPRVLNDKRWSGRSWTALKQKIEMWTSIVTLYSQRRLTEPEDRLNALAGVASELAVLWKDEYIHGMWKSDIINFLAWDVSKPSRPERSSRAPSWSWASLDGGVWFRMLWRIDVHIIAYEEPDRLSLNCMLLQDDEDLLKWFKLWVQKDLEYDEYPHYQAQYVLLGEIKRKKYMPCFGLIVIETTAGVFRRIGTFEDRFQENAEMWSSSERHNIILV